MDERDMADIEKQGEIEDEEEKDIQGFEEFKKLYGRRYRIPEWALKEFWLASRKPLREEIEKAIALLAAPDMKWDQAMRILFKLVGKEYPF